MGLFDTSDRTRKARRYTLFVLAAALLLVSVATTTYAAGRYVVSSSKQVKNGSLQAVDLSKKARTTLKGARGPAGPVGPQGPVGPSNAYADSFTTQVPLPGGTGATLLSVNVPAGSYVVSARLQGETGTDPNPGNNYRFDCTLAGQGVTFDAPTYRVGVEPSVERYLSYQGAATTTADGSIYLQCFAGNGHDLIAQTGQLTAIRVGQVS